MSKKLVGFYKGIEADSEGRMLTYIHNYDFNQLESIHNYIQWLFPLTEPSASFPDAPVMTTDDVIVFRSDTEIKLNMRTSFEIMLRFYGFEIDDNNKVVKSDLFDICALNWITPRNHNYLRITRILKSLVLVGLPNLADKFFDALNEVYQMDEHQLVIGEER